MDHHTQEDLDALRLKADVVAVAEELGVDTEGTRAEVTQRILDQQAAPTEEEPTPTEEAPTSPAEEEPTPTEEAPARARDDEGKFEGDDAATQPDDAYDPPTPKDISKRAKRFVLRHLEAYYGVGGVDTKLKNSVFKAMAAGQQVTVGPGKTKNERVSVTIHKCLFSAFKPTEDQGGAGVLINVSRLACDAKLYPS